MPPAMEVDTTGLNPCVITGALSDCTNCGASFTFWAKLDAGATGYVLTTGQQNPKTEGYQLFTMSNKPNELCLSLFRQGTGKVFMANCVTTKTAIEGQWTHFGFVYYVYPLIEIYFDGVKQIKQGVFGEMGWTNHPTQNFNVGASPLKMWLGKNVVDAGYVVPMDGIFDTFRIYDSPLTQAEVVYDSNN